MHATCITDTYNLSKTCSPGNYKNFLSLLPVCPSRTKFILLISLHLRTPHQMKSSSLDASLGEVQQLKCMILTIFTCDRLSSYHRTEHFSIRSTFTYVRPSQLASQGEDPTTLPVWERIATDLRANLPVLRRHAEGNFKQRTGDLLSDKVPGEGASRRKVTDFRR